MVLKTSASRPIVCSDWDDLVDEDGFLGGGRNRYHCSYMVYTDGTYYYAENGTTGNVDFGGPNNRGTPPVSGTDAAAVIQAALDGLTAGRTWKEKVVLKGAFPISDTIAVHSYTKLEISGSLTLDAAVNKNVIKIDHLASFVDILNGIINGNRTNNPDQGVDGEQCGIYGSGLTHSSIVGVKLNSCTREGLYISISSWLDITDIEADDNGQWGVVFDADAYTTAKNIRALNNLFSGIYIIGGGTLEDSNFSLIGGSVYGNTHFGVHVIVARGTSIIGVQSRRNGTAGAPYDGIFLEESDSIHISGCHISENYRHGIYIYKSNNCTVQANPVRNNNRVAGANNGIQLYESTYCLVQGNICTDDQIAKTQIYGIREDALCDYNRIEGNNVNGNLTGGIFETGANTAVKNNVGHVTENTGTATIIAAGANIAVAHGCAYTPDASDIRAFLTNQPTNDIGDIWIDTIGAANFTINCRNVPGVATAIFAWSVNRV